MRGCSLGKINFAICITNCKADLLFASLPRPALRVLLPPQISRSTCTICIGTSTYVEVALVGLAGVGGFFLFNFSIPMGIEFLIKKGHM